MQLIHAAMVLYIPSSLSSLQRVGGRRREGGEDVRARFLNKGM